MDKIQIITRYQDRVLAVESFGNNKKILLNRFKTNDQLMQRLYELNNHELTLTEEGLQFIKDYYTLDKAVELIIYEINKGVDFKYKNRGDIKNWIEAKGEYIKQFFYNILLS